jgi:restriction system protein
MASRYPYQQTVRNEYLGVSKVIRAMTLYELQWLAEAQLAKWSEQESRKRQQVQNEADRRTAKEIVENLKSQADEDTKQAQKQLDDLRSLLSASLTARSVLDWDSLMDCRGFPPFQFQLRPPNRGEIRTQLLGEEPRDIVGRPPVPETPGLLEFVVPFLRARRLNRDARAQDSYKRRRAEFTKRLDGYRFREREVVDAYNNAVRAFNAALKEANARYVRERNEFLTRQEAINKSVLEFRSRYEAASAEAVEQYARMVLERSRYPEPIKGELDVHFDESAKTLVTRFWLPLPSDLPSVVEHRFVAARKEIKPIQMKQKEAEQLYDDVIHQIALRSAHEIFVADYGGHVDAVVFNGWVHGVDRKTGKPFDSCILSYLASRSDFMAMDLAHVSPRECVRGLKGITAGPLMMLAPVQPIMELNRDDDRFVVSKQVLDQMRPQDNLAAMDWEDFEHLVRELFEKVFGRSGGEVRITQASRDRGVDAIAFDPDPIRGGKFVIQAKRYNMVVPVSAVRDLYGTMIAEGATKGILVTTSHFGLDSREFAKDKPITLIDGENLVHMFQEHGYNLHIAILPKGDPNRGIHAGGRGKAGAF